MTHDTPIHAEPAFATTSAQPVEPASCHNQVTLPPSVAEKTSPGDTQEKSDLANVKVLFLNHDDLVVRKRSFKACDSRGRLSWNACGASIVTPKVDERMVYVGNKDLGVVRDLEDDFEELCDTVIEDMVTEIPVAKGRTCWSG